MECPICMEILSGDVFSTSCGHIFCICIKTVALSSNCCPTCLQPLAMAGIKQIYLPNNVQQRDDSFNDAIVQSLIHDLEVEKKETHKKFKEMSDLFENLTTSFSKIDSSYDTIVAENTNLKKEVEDMKHWLDGFKVAILKNASEDQHKIIQKFLQDYLTDDNDAIDLV